MRARKLLLLCGLLSTGMALAAAPDLGTEQQREQGKQLYDKYCAQCHGVDGDGEGHATRRVKPRPRDFTSGKYKFRTTPSGMLPTDADLAKVIKDGLPYTSMPGWPQLSDAEIQNVIYYLKSFSDAFQNESMLADPITIGEPLPSSEESITRGREVYELMGCAACHGDQGRGNGASSPTLKDDWGNHLRPVDMTQRWTFRGGPTRKDIFRTFSTGVNGTPMPSYYDSLEEKDRWHLVNYIYSLGESDDPNYDTLLVAQSLDEELDISDPEALFAGASKARFPLLGQIVEPGRNFYPSHSSVEVRAVYNRQEIAFLVQWHDMRAETGGSNSPTVQVPPWDEDQGAAAPAEEEEAAGDDFWGVEVAAEDEGEEDFWGLEEDDAAAAAPDTEFSDAVALQLPSVLPTGNRKPYFIFGDSQSSVDLWFLDLARPVLVQQFTGRGSQSLESSETDEFEASATYDNGLWSVVFKRDLKGRGGVSFREGQFTPIAFSLWDGFNRERGNKRALSGWFYVYNEPLERVSPVVPMSKAAGIALLLELILIVVIRRRYARGAAGAGPDPAAQEQGAAS